MENIFSIKRKIYYHHTDSGGVVYYGRYMELLEECRTEFLFSKGINTKILMDEGTFFVVARIEADYRKPATYLDEVDISAEVEKVTASTIHFTQKVLRDSNLLVEAKVILVCVNEKFKPKRLPPSIKTAL